MYLEESGKTVECVNKLSSYYNDGEMLGVEEILSRIQKESPSRKLPFLLELFDNSL